MIEFNLLPDVKMEYLKTERTKHLVFSISLIISGVSLAIILLLFAALQLQNHQVTSNKKNIESLSSKLTGTTDVNKILTIQNQLKTVVGLYQQTPIVTRIYDYLPLLVPRNASVSHLTLNLTANTITISGTAGSLEVVNTFADTLKFASYTTDQNSNTTPAFKNVVLSSFSRDPSAASYSFNMEFDPALFSRSANVKLSVPSNYISTRSFTQLPSQDLFNGGGTAP